MTRKAKSPAASLVRSSAAEYLTLVAASGTGGVEAVYADRPPSLAIGVKEAKSLTTKLDVVEGMQFDRGDD